MGAAWVGASTAGGEVVNAQDVIIYRRLLDNGIQVWLSGGRGIDALLGEQTRPHKDLDTIMLLDDVARLRDLLGQDGYGLEDLWSENRWAVDAHGTEIPTAFIRQDAEGRQFDAHAMQLDDHGNGVSAWEGDEKFGVEDSDDCSDHRPLSTRDAGNGAAAPHTQLP